MNTNHASQEESVGTQSATATINSKETSMTNQLVPGASVQGVVTAKNQHGATVQIGETSAFLPTDQITGELSKGSEVTVTVTDTTGAKPRLSMITTPAAETVETVETPEVEDELAASLRNLAASWGATLTVDNRKKGGSNTSSKPSKQRTRPVVTTAPVVTAVAVVEPETKTEPVQDTTPAAPKSAKRLHLESLKVGDEVVATVKFTKEFGAFMQVGPSFGLLHESELPGATAEERKAFLSTLRYKQQPKVNGEPVKVTIVSIDLDKERLGLSLIAGEKAAFFAGLQVGSVVEGTVTGVKEIGAFVKLGRTTGFLHVSQVEGNTREERDAKLPTLKGEKLTLIVVDVDRAKQEVRLSQRHVGLAKFTVASAVSGTISQVTKNVVILDLEGGVRGFLPRPSGQRFEVGAELSATVKSIDFARGSVQLA